MGRWKGPSAVQILNGPIVVAASFPQLFFGEAAVLRCCLISHLYRSLRTPSCSQLQGLFQKTGWLSPSSEMLHLGAGGLPLTSQEQCLFQAACAVNGMLLWRPLFRAVIMKSSLSAMPPGSWTVKCIFLQPLPFGWVGVVGGGGVGDGVADRLKQRSQWSCILFLCTCLFHAARNQREEAETGSVIRLGSHRDGPRRLFFFMWVAGKQNDHPKRTDSKVSTL